MEVVQADLDDIASLKAVLEGAYATFVVSDFHKIKDADKETQQVGARLCYRLSDKEVLSSISA